MLESSQVRQQSKENIARADTLQRTKINRLPEDFDTLIYELRQVQETFRSASKMSNVGARQFNAKLGEVIEKLQRASQLVEDTMLQ